MKADTSSGSDESGDGDRDAAEGSSEEFGGDDGLQAAAAGIDPSREDIPEDIYIACGGRTSQVLGRNMHAEYGTLVPSAAVYNGRRAAGGKSGGARKGGDDDEAGGVVDDCDDDDDVDSRDGGGSQISVTSSAMRRSTRTKISTAPREDDLVAERASGRRRGGASGRGRRTAARGGAQRGRRGGGGGTGRRSAWNADPSLKDLSGLWEDGEEDDDGGGGDSDDDSNASSGGGGGPPAPPPPGGPPSSHGGGGGPGGGGGGGGAGFDPDAAVAVRFRERCWLCTFSTHAVARHVSAYVAANVSTVDTLHMASQIKQEIMDRFPHARGARRRDIVR